MGDIDLKKLLTGVLLCMMILWGWALFTGRLAPPPPADQPGQTAPAEQAATSPTAPLNDAAPAVSTGASGWKLSTYPQPPEPVVLGSREKGSPYKAQINLGGAAAAIDSVYLSEYKLNVNDEETGYPLLAPAQDRNDRPVQSMMLGQLKIRTRTETFDLSQGCWQVQRDNSRDNVQSVTYTATILDATGQPAIEIHKTFRYRPDDYEMDFDLRFVNLTFLPLEIESLQINGPVGVRREDRRYERRAVTAAFRAHQDEVDVERQALEHKKKEPFTTLKKPGDPLLWFAQSNKFFTAVVRPLPQKEDGQIDFIDKNQVQAQHFYRFAGNDEQSDDDETMGNLVILATPIPSASEQASTDLHFKVYLGAIDTDLFNEAPYAGLYYESLMRSLACSMCAFDWLTALVLKMMKGIYGIVHNYGIAVIVLVLLVRLLLHPITKKSQVNMMAMTRAQGKLAPRLDEIKKKYAGNNAEIQKHTMALYKEQGVNPAAGCIGMLPMLLQMPLWIALFTAVDSSVSLRHQGLFPASWHWITDLSAPDRLIPFTWLGIEEPIYIPLLSSFMGGIDAFNLLPILLCVAMFLQQKLTTQTSMASTNPQMAQQQKMLLVLMPIMMLLFFYTAPSGLNLYIMASTFGGLIESHFIRKHIREKEAQEATVTVATTRKIGAKLEPKKKKPKPPVRFN